MLPLHKTHTLTSGTSQSNMRCPTPAVKKHPMNRTFDASTASGESSNIHSQHRDLGADMGTHPIATNGKTGTSINRRLAMVLESVNVLAKSKIAVQEAVNGKAFAFEGMDVAGGSTKKANGGDGLEVRVAVRSAFAAESAFQRIGLRGSLNHHNSGRIVGQVRDEVVGADGWVDGDGEGDSFVGKLGVPIEELVGLVGCCGRRRQ